MKSKRCVSYNYEFMILTFWCLRGVITYSQINFQLQAVSFCKISREPLNASETSEDSSDFLSPTAVTVFLLNVEVLQKHNCFPCKT